ncbi:MAG: zinc ribbon domain-containing protein [Salinibacter sp.]
MALVDCPECTKDVSEHADACPHCGYPFEESAGNAEEGVVLSDIDIGFNFWARTLLKAGLAALPVVIVAVLLYFVLTAVATMIVGGMFGG